MHRLLRRGRRDRPLVEFRRHRLAAQGSAALRQGRRPASPRRAAKDAGAMIHDGDGESQKRAREVQSGPTRAAVLGLSDGLVTNVSLILGVVGAQASPHFVQLAGFASLVPGPPPIAPAAHPSIAPPAPPSPPLPP